MSQNSRPKLLYLRILLVTTLLLNTIAAYQLFWPIYKSGILFTSRRWMAVFLLGVSVIGLEFFLLCITATVWKDKFIHFLETTLRTAGRMRWFNLVLFTALMCLYAIAIFGPTGENFQPIR